MSTTNETILSVDGMTCPSCIRHVQGALRKLEGVGDVQVQLEDGKVRVKHDLERATVDQLIQALGDAGYRSRAPGARP